MMAFALDPNTKIESLPAVYVPQLTGDTVFTQKNGEWISGAVSLSNPQGFALKYELTCPEGLMPVDENGNDVFSDWDFITGAHNGYHIYGGQTSVSVAKVWDDEDNRDGVRPDKVVVNLIVNGVVDENQFWS